MRKAVSLICIRNKSLLIVCDDDRLTWTVPGGNPESNETDIACLQREVREELATTVSDLRFYKCFEGASPHQGDLIEENGILGIYHPNLSPRGGITPFARVKNF